jgi:hypothetical protein
VADLESAFVRAQNTLKVANADARRAAQADLMQSRA